MSNVIGRRHFTDSKTRDGQGQYFLDDDGQRVYGVWLLEAEAFDEAPLIVEA